MAPHVAQTTRQSPTEPVCCSAIVGDTKIPDPGTIIANGNFFLVEGRPSDLFYVATVVSKLSRRPILPTHLDNFHKAAFSCLISGFPVTTRTIFV
jgi:hypothetical protein